ncbi:uncharacterized protein V6R79_001484 [Siganus canaliculatus]
MRCAQRQEQNESDTIFNDDTLGLEEDGGSSVQLCGSKQETALFKRYKDSRDSLRNSTDCDHRVDTVCQGEGTLQSSHRLVRRAQSSSNPPQSVDLQEVEQTGSRAAAQRQPPRRAVKEDTEKQPKLLSDRVCVGPAHLQGT